ncbi:hypothetical protein TruAng_010534 [Truncatella angustata]|nr:hypothetical protein TruAng_010534 [Truncatella angustata]
MATSSSDSFQNSFNQTASAVSAGVIAAIVLAVVAGIGSIIAGFCLWNRSKKRREARDTAFQPMSNANNYQYGGTASQYNNINQQATPYNSASPHGGQTELYGSTVSPRSEAPNTPAPYPEAAGREISVAALHDNAQAELGGDRVKRSELA